MRKITCSFIAVAMVFFYAGLLSAQVLMGDSWEKASAAKSGKIVAVYLEEDAFAYIDAKGNLTGIEVDIFEHFVNWVKNAKGVNLQVEYIGDKSFSGFYNAVQNAEDGVFGLGTITILERRATEVKFSPPFINNIALLVTHNSVGELSSMGQIATAFAGKKAIVAKGSTLEGYMREVKAKYHPNLVIELADSQIEAMDKVAVDPSYFAYLDLSIYWPGVQGRKLPIKRHAVGDLSQETFGFIMPLKTSWQPVITEFFNLGNGYRSNPAYKNILLRHLGPEVTKMLELARRQQGS